MKQEQPEALRLADALTHEWDDGSVSEGTASACINLLRSLHALVGELSEKLMIAGTDLAGLRAENGVLLSQRSTQEQPEALSQLAYDAVCTALTKTRSLRNAAADNSEHRSMLNVIADRLDVAASHLLRLHAENEALRKDAKRFIAMERLAHWEPERDMGPGGRWWIAVHAPAGKPTLRAAIDAAMKGQS